MSGLSRIGSDDRRELRAVDRAANLTPCEVCGAEWQELSRIGEHRHWHLEHAPDCPEGAKPCATQ